MKERTKEQLLQAGAELFGSYGLQKTTISDITKSVGIATGTFYNYFESKEVLYFTVLEREEAKLQERLYNFSLYETKEKRDLLRQIFRNSLAGVKENPLLKQLYDQETFLQLLTKLPQQYIDEHVKKDEDSFLLVVRKWQEAGLVEGLDPKLVSSIIRALFTLSLHEREIGEDHYQETLSWYIERVLDGLMGGDLGGED